MENTQDQTDSQNNVNPPSENMGKDEQVGFHKGSLSTLAKEREELSRILGIVEQIMQMHVKALKDLGIDLQQQAQQAQPQQTQSTQADGKPIEDLLK